MFLTQELRPKISYETRPLFSA